MRSCRLLLLCYIDRGSDYRNASYYSYSQQRNTKGRFESGRQKQPSVAAERPLQPVAARRLVISGAVMLVRIGQTARLLVFGPKLVADSPKPVVVKLLVVTG